MKLQILIDGVAYEVEVDDIEGSLPGALELTQPAARATIQSTVVPTAANRATEAESVGVEEAKVCRSPVAGLVAQVHVQAGATVDAGALIFVLEAMKMETKITAPAGGTLKSVRVAAGDAVKLNQILAEFE